MCWCPIWAASMSSRRNSVAVQRVRFESGVSRTAPADKGSPRRRSSLPTRRRRWPRRVALVLIALILIVVAAFLWDRWLRYDDAYDVQGEWQAQDSTKIIVIDEASIKLTDEVAYPYTLDSTAKTMSFTFGAMSGSGRYRFSADRSQLIITDGSSYSTVSTLLEDIVWTGDTLVRVIQGHEPEYPSGDGVTVLARISRNAAAAPSEGVLSSASSQESTESDEESAQAEQTSLAPAALFDVGDVTGT